MAAHTYTRRGMLGAIALAPMVLAVPAAAFTTSRVEALRLEYLRVLADCEASDDPTDEQYSAITKAEARILETPCMNKVDAEAKLLFAIKLEQDGMCLDSEDAHALLSDAARFLLTRSA